MTFTIELSRRAAAQLEAAALFAEKKDCDKPFLRGICIRTGVGEYRYEDVREGLIGLY